MKALTYILITALVLSMFTACTTEPKEGGNEPGMEEGKDPTALDESLKKTQLPRKYSDMLRAMAQNPNDQKKNGLFTNEIATYYIEEGVNNRAIDILKQGIVRYPKSNNTPSNIILLIEVLKKDKSKQQDYINLVQSCSVGYPSIRGLDEFTGDVPKDEPKMQNKIAKLQGELTDKKTGRLDLLKVNNFVNTIQHFVIGNPTNEDSPRYLKLAAEVINSVKVYPRAIEFYDWILNSFPNSKEAPQALFMKGFTLDDGLNNKQAAKPVYEEFLKKYPKNDFADDTQFLLDNINKSDEEIIKEFDDKKE